MYEFLIIEPDGHCGWVWTSTYQRAVWIASDYMTEWEEFLVVIPTGRSLS